MSWQNILKMMGPRQFMEGLQEKLGGDISGGHKSKQRTGRRYFSPVSFQLNYDGGSVKLNLQKDTTYKINVNGKIFVGFSLKKLLEQAMEHLEGGEE